MDFWRLEFCKRLANFKFLNLDTCELEFELRMFEIRNSKFEIRNYGMFTLPTRRQS
jgi:hypothetical protein